MATIYDDIGGAAGIEAAVEAFYVRVVADPLLAPYFKGVEMHSLKQAPARLSGRGARRVTRPRHALVRVAVGAVLANSTWFTTAVTGA